MRDQGYKYVAECPQNKTKKTRVRWVVQVPLDPSMQHESMPLGQFTRGTSETHPKPCSIAMLCSVTKCFES